MTDITWGRKIPINGVRPAWLAADQQIMMRDTGIGGNNNDGWYGDIVRFSGIDIGRRETAIRLPADHFAYLALDKGFEPWGGGDAAPDDWDGGQVLLRDGTSFADDGAIGWWSHDGGGLGAPHESDIIGYRKCAKQPADTVPVARMTADQAREWAIDRDVPDSQMVAVMGTLAQLGLIREETRAERFNRETGHDLTPAVLAALEYER